MRVWDALDWQECSQPQLIAMQNQATVDSQDWFIYASIIFHVPLSINCAKEFEFFSIHIIARRSVSVKIRNLLTPHLIPAQISPNCSVIYLPGQSLIRQDVLFVPDPLQALPLCCGRGLLQLLLAVIVPVPHGLLHWLQLLHLPQLPLTGDNTAKMIYVTVQHCL